MKILVLNGSPKKESDTMRMTEAFLEGLNKLQRHDIKVIRVIERSIAPCRGCLSCWQRGDGHCVLQDDQNEILRAIRESELVIWSFPLYCYAMPSHLKAVVDRLMPLSRQRMQVGEDGHIRHEMMTANRKNVVITGSGFPNWEGNFTPLRLMCANAFRDLTMICVPEAPLMHVPAAACVAEPKLQSFRLAGEEYDQSGDLSENTIRILEYPMISAEEYLRNVNQ